MDNLARLTMILVGFLLVFLGLITFIHSTHYIVGVLVSFSGVVIMFEGLPKYE